jgi:thiol:disulfide interchange protein DsbD
MGAKCATRPSMTRLIRMTPDPMSMRKRLRAATLLGALLLLVMASLRIANAAEFLPPEEAFKVNAHVVGATTIEATWTIADGYYMYHERFGFKLAPAGVQIGAANIPQGKIKFDKTLEKNVETHRGQVTISIPIVSGSGAFKLIATGQGCADEGLCYPPQQVELDLATLEVKHAIPNAANENDRIAAALRSGSLLSAVSLFFVFGVALSLTPCVLPMIPILSSIIVGQGATGRGRNFLLAVTYSLGMAMVYTALGIAAGLAGEGLAASLQQPWVLAAFAMLLVVLACSMFGFYELQVPASWQSRLAGASNRQRSGSLAGVFIMGAISALIVGPCVAAPLAGALVYISQTRDVWLGGSALFALACGMSVPLLLVGLSAGSLLPRAGAWMESVKHVFGALLIGVAIWMVSPVLPDWAQLLAWSVLAMVCAVYLRALEPLTEGTSGWTRLAKGIGAVLLVWGVLLLVGIAGGGHSVLQPLDFLASSGKQQAAATEAHGAMHWQTVSSVSEVDSLLAKSKGTPMMLDFYADWCVSCIEMEKFTFSDTSISAQLTRMVLARADVTANTAEHKALLKRFGLFGPPGIVFFDRNGKELSDARVIGFQSAEKFNASLAAPLAAQ